MMNIKRSCSFRKEYIHMQISVLVTLELIFLFLGVVFRQNIRDYYL
jgi:hypothetical protein